MFFWLVLELGAQTYDADAVCSYILCVYVDSSRKNAFCFCFRSPPKVNGRCVMDIQ